MPIGLRGKKNKEVNKVVLLDLDEIVSNRNQPRKYFDPEALQDLSRSIAANGLLQPITVRRNECGEYEIVAGERRAMAFRSLGREKIPAIIEDVTNEESAVLALIENLQRKDLNYFEEAAGIAKLMHGLGITQQQISQQLGKAQSTIANKLRLLKYSPDMQAKILEADLTERHARAMLKITDENVLKDFIDHVISENLNVDQTEKQIDRLLQKNSRPPSTRIFIVKDMRIFLNSINKAVDMMKDAGIPIDTKKSESDDYVEYILKIPKSSVYRRV